jgi:hypothetical protein
MALRTLSVEPGVVLDDTASASKGRWIAADRVRFEDGRAQVIGGWERLSLTNLGGVCRAAFSWICACGEHRLGFGSHDRLEVLEGGAVYDITPSSGFTAGEVDGLAGEGFGTGAYSAGTYGSGSGVPSTPQLWSLNGWGENLLASARGQGLYEWALNTATPAAAVSGAPTNITSMMVTPERFVVLMGTTEEVSGDYNPMLVRWCDQEDNTGWTTTATGEAGELELEGGSRLVAGMPGNQEQLIWSDTTLFAMRQTFDDLIWSFPIVGRNCGLRAQNGAAMINGVAYWMGQNAFYSYDGGAVRTLPCPLDRDVFDNIAPGQSEKCFAGVNEQYGEVWWFYPDARDGNECSRYVMLNINDGTWSSGVMERTAWCHSAFLCHPVAASPDGEIYMHELGESADGGVIGASIETGLYDLADGENMLYLRGCMPDVADQEGGLRLTVYTRETARGAETTHGPYTLASNTEWIWFEARGRFVRYRIEGVSAPSYWRLGDMRFDVKPTGMRM